MIYDVPGVTVIDCFDRGELRSLVSGVDKDYQYQTQNFRLAMGTSDENALKFGESSELGVKLLYPAGNSLIWIDGKITERVITTRIYVTDFLVISNNAIEDVEQILSFFRPSLVILDSSNGYYYADKWIEILRSRGINAYSTRHSGGLVIDLLNDQGTWISNI